MKLCEKCSQMIRPHQLYTSHDKDSTSGAGVTIHVHVVCPIRRDRP